VPALGVDGAAVAVVTPAEQRVPMYASNSTANVIEDLTTTLGEGPAADAATGRPTLAVDLNGPEATQRWPAFAPAAVDAGVRALFALPLRVGSVRVGVLTLCRAQPGGLQRDQLADALVLADSACALLLDQGIDAAPDGHADGRGPEYVGMQHPEIHQATGMIIVQLGVTAEVALLRLRAYAYLNDRRLRDVASEVVARHLRFHPDSEHPEIDQ
jgi:ANTAR domain-containing protein/GAF domain-containing protein